MSLLQERLKAVNNAQIQQNPTDIPPADNIFKGQNNTTDNGNILVKTPENNENSFEGEDDILNAIRNNQEKKYDKKANSILKKETAVENKNVIHKESFYSSILNDTKSHHNEDFMSEEMLEAYELKREREEREQLRKSKMVGKVSNILLSICCFYIIFLIYGVSVTNYYYNDEGRIVPQVLSVKDIEDGKEFEVLLLQYEKCKILYEDVLMLDYRLSQGVEDPLLIAPEYEAMLDEVENLIVQIEALDTNTRYEQVKNMLLTWVRTDMAVYLQKMSSAISQNNQEDASIALTYKTVVYNDFSLITENIVIMGDNINGIDMTDIKNWSPERYIDNIINGNK